MASRVRSWRKPKTSGSISVSSPRAMRSRSTAIRSASSRPVTAASTSNVTRRPRTAAVSITVRPAASSSSTWSCTASARFHGRGAEPRSSRATPPDASSSSSRKNGLPPLRAVSASTTRAEGWLP